MNKCEYCGHHGEHVCTAIRTPCCGLDTVSNPDVICWDPYDKVVECYNCDAKFRMLQPDDQHVEGDEPFRLLALGERMVALAEKLEGKFTTSAVINYLQASRDALDANEEEESRILRDAMDVLVDRWSD
jgi:hypothetical protein